MSNIVLIGVGGIGFRHYQAILNYKGAASVYVIDMNKEALERCMSESENKNDSMSLRFSTNIEDLPKEIDVLIIATSSKPRCELFKQVVLRCEVKNVIFEKFLFPKIEEYDEVGRILEEKHINAYVNCPGRMYPGYKKLKEKLDKTKGCYVHVLGSNWGLSCNAIHIVDQIGFLFDTYEPIVVNNMLVDTEVNESKRTGYVEFTGRLVVSIGKKITILLDSFKDGSVPYLTTLINDNKVYTISETEKWIVTDDRGQSEKDDFETLYQSQLTDKVLYQLMEEGRCELTSYEDTKQWHEALLNSFSEIYHKNMKNNGECPIT